MVSRKKFARVDQRERDGDRDHQAGPVSAEEPVGDRVPRDEQHEGGDAGQHAGEGDRREDHAAPFPELVVGVVVEAALRRGGESRIHEGDPDRRDHSRELQQPELLGREEASVDRQRDHADRLNRNAAQAVDECLLGDADDVAGLFGLSRVGSPAFEIGSHGYSVVR